MGSWNGTCFLSHLPIEHGDKIKIIFLRKNVYVDSYTNNVGVCYADHFFKPLYFPISGEYDDYGGIENIELNIISKQLDLFKNEIGAKNSQTIFTDTVFMKSLEPWTWENIWRSLERGIGKFYLENEDEEIEFGKDIIGIMIRQDVWDAVINVQMEADYGWTNENLTSFLTKLWQKIEEDDADTQKWLKFDSFDKLFNFYSSGVFFRDFYDIIFGKDKLRDDKLETLLNGKEVFDLDIFKKCAFEMFAISAHLTDTRRIWGWSGSGSGGQSTNWKTYQKLYQVYSDISKEAERKYEDE